MATPVIWRHLSATGFCTAMPPPLHMRSAEKSRWAKSGLLASALYSVFTAGSMLTRYFASSLTKAGMSRGFTIRTFSAPMRMPHIAHAVSAKIWYSGSAHTIVTCSPAVCFMHGSAQASVCSTLAITLRWVSVAPFETPVVPPVYCRKATSSTLSSAGLNGMRSPWASASLKVTMFGSENSGTIFLTLRTTKLTSMPFTPPSISPMLATTTWRTGVLPITFCTVWAKFSSTMIASLPESVSWCSSSRAVYRGLTLTTV